MSEKKRKRGTEDAGQSKKKKLVRHAVPGLKFSVVGDTGSWQPIIASTPGLELPASSTLDTYAKVIPNHGVDTPSFEVLLHTSIHPKLDYTATEEKSSTAENHLKHYVGIYDPASGEVQLVPARKMVLRGTLRSGNTLEEDVEEVLPSKAYGARVILGEAFGTKKSQKAIRALTENAIASPANKRNGEGRPVLNASATAVLDTMAEASASMPTKEALQATMDQAKPRPKANLEATDPREVYSLAELVGTPAFKCINIASWQEGVKKGENVPTTSQFVSKNLFRIVKDAASGMTEKAKALRFLLILIQWYKALKSAGRDGKKLAQKEDIQKAVPDVETLLLDQLRRRFAPNLNLNKWDIDYLLTHICALAITLDTNCETDTYYLCEDLGLEMKQMTQYFQEIGCRVLPLSEADRKKTSLTKATASAHRIAKLRIPLEFPKVRIPPSRRR